MRQNETCRSPSGARHLVGATMAPMCKRRYPVHFVARDVKCMRTIVDQAFSVPKCVKLARVSEKSYELLFKMFASVPEKSQDELEPVLRKKFTGYASRIFSDSERQKQKGSSATDYSAKNYSDKIQRVTLEMKPMLEASGKRNWIGIMLTGSHAIVCYRHNGILR